MVNAQAILLTILAGVAWGCDSSKRDAALASPAQIPDVPSTGKATLEFFEADARWVFHGPNMDNAWLNIRIKASAKEPTVLRLKKSWLSHEANKLGNEIPMALLDAQDQPVERLTIGSEDRVILLRGKDVYPKDSIGKDVFVALELLIDGESALIRKATRVTFKM